MKIGSIPAAYGTSSQESRLTETAAGSGPRYGSVVDVGRSIMRAGEGLENAFNAYAAQEKERLDFRALADFIRMNGEVQRELEEAKGKLPADGAGFVSLSDSLYSKRYSQFVRGLQPWQQEYFAYRAEQARQALLTDALNFENEAARGFALNTIDGYVEERLGNVYENPAYASRVEDEVAELLENSPLSALEKQAKAREIIDRLRAVSFEGRLYGAYKAAFAAPGSPDAARVFDAIVIQESGGNPNVPDSRPHPKYGGRGGALGVAQVMPETGRIIAAQINDTDFPFNGSEEDQKAYIRANSYRYGKYYFEQGLTKYNGDVLLATIRYNGGDGAVEDFVRSGRNPASLSGVRAQTREYVEQIWRRNGWGDPWRAPSDSIVRAGLGPEQIRKLDAAEDEFNRARFEAAQRQAMQDEKVLAKKIQTYFDDMRARVFVNPTSIDGELEQFAAYLVRQGVEPEKLIEASRGQLNAILAEREGTDEAIFDTEGYAGIPYRDRRRLSEAARARAEAEREQALKERKAAQEAAVARAVALADLGNFTMADLGEMVRNQTVVAGSEDYMKIKGIIERAQADNITAMNVAEKLSAGEVFSPNVETRRDLGVYAKKAGIIDGLAAGDEGARSAVRSLWRAAQVMPDNVRTFLENSVLSIDTKRSMAAFLLLDTLQAENPGAFEREMGAEIAAKTRAYRTLKGLGYSEDAIATRMNADVLMAPQDRKLLEGRLEEYFRGESAFTPQKLQDEFRFLFAADPVFGTMLEEGPNLELAWQDYVTEFRHNYVLYGDAGQAHEATMERLKRLYGSFEGSLVKYPPQNYYPAIDQSHDWIMEQFRREFKVKPEEKVRVVNDWRLGEERVRNHEVPTYDMVILRENGVPEVVRNWYGDFAAEVEHRRKKAEEFGLPITASDEDISVSEKMVERIREVAREYVEKNSAFTRGTNTRGTERLSLQKLFLQKSLPALLQNPEFRKDRALFEALNDDVQGVRPLPPEFAEMLRQE